MRPFFPVILSVCILALGGCDEQQVLYTVESEEPIPEAPRSPAEFLPPASVGGGPEVELPPAPLPAAYDANALDEPTRQLAVAGIGVPVPLRFQSEDTGSAMRAAQFRVPNATGPDGELVVFFFGEGQGGSARENAERWARQFTPPPDRETAIMRFEAMDPHPALLATRITLVGTWAQPAMGPNVPAMEPRPAWGMDAVILEGGPGGTVFYRLTGPRGLVMESGPVIEHLAANATVLAVDGPGDEPPALPGPTTTAVIPTEPNDPPSADPEPEGEDVALAKVEAPGVTFAVPATWTAQEPDSSMRALQFRLPGAAGAGDGEFVVFYFGVQGGGTVEDNLARWANQVRQPDGTPPADAATKEKTRVGEFTISSVYTEGTYAPTAMRPGAPAPTPIEDHALMGIIVEGGAEGPLYWRLTGPAETIRSQRDNIALLLRSLRKEE